MTPAYRTNTICTVFTWLVAQARLLVLVFGAGKYSTDASAVRVLVTRNSNICHTELAIRGADTTANVVETIVANWIVQKTVLFTNWSFFKTSIMRGVTDTSAISVWLATVGSIIAEAIGTFLPANRSISAVSVFAFRVA